MTTRTRARGAALCAALASTLVLGSGAAWASGLLEFDAAVAVLTQADPTLDPPPRDGNRDFVVGGFQAYGFNNGLSVHSGPDGEDVRGMASVTDPDFDAKIREKAVCLAVAGNLASAGFRGTFQVGDETFPYEEVVVMRDGGPGGTLDGLDAWLPPPGGPEACAELLHLAAASTPIERGNILINDAH